VSSLVGRPRIKTDEDGCGIVPLLLPREHGLPFAMSLDIICFDSADAHHASTALDSLQEEAPTVHHQVLDLFYVLSGEGVLLGQDGASHRVHAGDSILAWHGSTQLVVDAPQEQPSTSSHGQASETQQKEPLAAVKFHLPLSLLVGPQQGSSPQPGFVAPSEDELESMLFLGQSSLKKLSGRQSTPFTEEEAVSIMATAQLRARHLVSSLYSYDEDSMPSTTADAAVAAIGRAAQVVAAGGSVPASAGPPQHTLVMSVFRGAAVAAYHAAQGWVSGLYSALQQQVAAAPRPGATGQLLPVTASGSGRAAAAVAPPPAGSHAQGPAWPWADSTSGDSPCVLMQRAMEEFTAYRFPRQTNKLAFVFDPTELNLALSFGVEVFEPGHHTPIHVHPNAHELFFVLAGSGTGYCDGHTFTVKAGDVAVFPPRSKHGIDNDTGDKLYCLQLMAPNEHFVEHVKTGTLIGALDDEDICNLTNTHC